MRGLLFQSQRLETIDEIIIDGPVRDLDKIIIDGPVRDYR